MKRTQSFLFLAMLMAALGTAQAGDLNGAVAYSLGEFDRVGMTPAAPKLAAASTTAKGESRATDKRASDKTMVAKPARNREMEVQKVEFVRRMFWMALSMR